MKQMSGTRLFVIAVVCGLIAASLVIYYLKQVEEKYRRANEPVVEQTVAVVVPRRDMAEGEVVTVESIGRLEMPIRFAPSNYISAADYQKVVNRTLTAPVQTGKPITWEFITGRAAEKFSENLDIGRRAMSIRVSKIDSFDGLLRPGDSIDLMGKFELGSLGIETNNDDEQEDVIMPVLEQVAVLSAGREDYTGRRYERNQTPNSIDGFDMEFTIITLHLTPRQVARVELAQNTGTLFAVLRHPEDTSKVDYDYQGGEILLSKDRPEAIDLVMGADGRPIGRIVGDNIVDANGNVIGKVIDGKAVGLDGRALGQIVRNVDPDDPILRVAQTADVVRDAQGNIIGRVVDGKIIDKHGNVVGNVDASGRALGLDGNVIGTVQENVALDAQGNAVDLSASGAAAGQTKMEQVVRDAQGNIIGRVVNGQIVDKDGKVVGRIDANGEAVGLDGTRLGKVDNVMVGADGKVIGQVKEVVRDASGRVVGTVEEVVRDAQGNIIGRIVNGQVVNERGEVVGTIGADGKAIGLDGAALGTVEKIVRDQQGNVVGNLDQVLRDTKGSIQQAVVDENGNVVGEIAEVVRDAQGNIIGRVVDGNIVDVDGKVIGKLRNGQVVGTDGKVLHSGVTVATENAAAVDSALRRDNGVIQDLKTIDFIPGGTGKDGIVPVKKVRLE